MPTLFLYDLKVQEIPQTESMTCAMLSFVAQDEKEITLRHSTLRRQSNGKEEEKMLTVTGA